MHKDDEYRKEAAEAQRFADRAITNGDKAAWLRIAQGWLALIHRPAPTDREAFEGADKAHGTGQESSDKSN
jgi:hypothetical protein